MTPNELVVAHMGDAKRIAHSAYRKVPRGATTQENDLLSAAYLGLVEASRRYDASRDRAFINFAVSRVIGAIKDFQRTVDLRSRTDVKQGVPPARVELYNEISFEDHDVSPGQNTAEVAMRRGVDIGLETPQSDFLENERLRRAIELLPERTVLALAIRMEGATLREVGRQLGFTESRACQIVNDALEQLRETLQGQVV